MTRPIPTAQRDLVRLALDLRPTKRPPTAPAHRTDIDRHEHRA